MFLLRELASALAIPAVLLPATLLAACGIQPTETSKPAGVAPAWHVSDAVGVAVAQLDVSLDHSSHQNSSWGQVIVKFTGSSEVQYFNLAFDGEWRIRNMPVLSREGAHVVQSTAFLFNLGAPDGEDVSSGRVAFDLGASVLIEMPGHAVTMPVSHAVWGIETGFRHGTISYSPPPASLIGAAATGNKVAHTSFPNQKSGVNQCVPVALSNSLQWLNKKYNLGLAEADMSIETMKTVVGWTPTGAGPQWWSRKRTRFKDVLTTTTIPRFNIAEVHAAVAEGCDVELSANEHVVSVTGAEKLSDGRYSLDLTHDPNQRDDKAPGAEGTQTVIWDPKSKTFSGAPFIEGKAADLIVKECPKKRT